MLFPRGAHGTLNSAFRGKLGGLQLEVCFLLKGLGRLTVRTQPEDKTVGVRDQRPPKGRETTSPGRAEGLRPGLGLEEQPSFGFTRTKTFLAEEAAGRG